MTQTLIVDSHRRRQWFWVGNYYNRKPEASTSSVQYRLARLKKRSCIHVRHVLAIVIGTNDHDQESDSNQFETRFDLLTLKSPKTRPFDSPYEIGAVRWFRGVSFPNSYEKTLIIRRFVGIKR